MVRWVCISFSLCGFSSASLESIWYYATGLLIDVINRSLFAFCMSLFLLFDSKSRLSGINCLWKCRYFFLMQLIVISSSKRLLRSAAHTRGLIAANKLQGQIHQVNWQFLLHNLVRGTNWSLRLVPRIQTSLNFCGKSLRLAPQNASCEVSVR